MTAIPAFRRWKTGEARVQNCLQLHSKLEVSLDSMKSVAREHYI